MLMEDDESLEQGDTLHKIWSSQILSILVIELVGFDDRLNMGMGERNEGVENESKISDLSNKKHVVAIYLSLY